MSRLVTLDFYPEAFQFSAGHFTIFSATERERLHGHTYTVAAEVTARIQEPGITFNYQIFKSRLTGLCEQLDRYFLLPAHSPYLIITEQSDTYQVLFNQDRLSFLKKEVLLLPLSNTTLEELSRWFVEQLTADRVFIQENCIEAIVIKVFNSPAQSASHCWTI